jgi:hypothetical protein
MAWNGRCSLLLTILLFCAPTLTRGEDAPRQFTPEAWRAAADPKSPDWSRKDLLQQLAANHPIIGMSRQQLIQLLGDPGMSQQNAFPGSMLPGSHMDFWRLSARNDESFRVDYGPDGKVATSTMEGDSCACQSCGDAGDKTPRIDSGRLRDDLWGKTDTGLTFSDLEQMSGVPGQRETVPSTVLHQVWVKFSEQWHVGGELPRFFVASGELPQNQAVPFEQVRVAQVALITLWPECLAPPH